MKIETFLRESKKYLYHLDKYSTVHVVIGNEACDLDSAISALVYALYKSHLLSSNDKLAVVPVLNIPLADFPLKTEVIFYLEENDVPTDLLIFRDQIDLSSLQSAGKLQLTLVDHHVLPPADKDLEKCVVEIIDHRPRDSSVNWDGRDVTIETVGSCSTLVAERVFDKIPHLITPQVATLLMGPILLDTSCLSEAVGRATSRDRAVVCRLGVLVPSTMQDTFRMLQSARTDVRRLAPEQLLTKDLKVVAGLPISSLPLLVKDFVQFKDFSSGLQKFCRDGGFKAVVMLGMQVLDDGNTVNKDIAVYSKSEIIQTKLVSALEASTDPSLKLEAMEGPTSNITLLKQGNTNASRKQILPILKACCETEKITFDLAEKSGNEH